MYQPIFHMWKENHTIQCQSYTLTLCGTTFPMDGRHNVTVRSDKVTCKKCLKIINKEKKDANM